MGFHALFLVVVTLPLVLLPVARAYHFRSPVSALKRSQYRSRRTPWSEVLGSDAPRFGMDRTITLNPVQQAKMWRGDEEFKISFAFDHERFLTSWITVTDGGLHFLDFVEFTFTSSGDDIVAFSYETEYHSDGSRPDHIYVRYRWQDAREMDSVLGINILLLVCAASGWMALLCVIGLPVQRRHSGPSPGTTLAKHQ